MNPGEILKQWLAAINGYNVSAVAALVAADHVFVDSLGNRVDGARAMEASWRSYFAMRPDYWIREDCAIHRASFLRVNKKESYLTKSFLIELLIRSSGLLKSGIAAAAA